jgi:hypothetical protein
MLIAVMVISREKTLDLIWFSLLQAGYNQPLQGRFLPTGSVSTSFICHQDGFFE